MSRLARREPGIAGDVEARAARRPGGNDLGGRKSWVNDIGTELLGLKQEDIGCVDLPKVRRKTVGANNPACAET